VSTEPGAAQGVDLEVGSVTEWQIYNIVRKKALSGRFLAREKPSPGARS
jgi:hypothetical protein